MQGPSLCVPVGALFVEFGVPTLRRSQLPRMPSYVLVLTHNSDPDQVWLLLRALRDEGQDTYLLEGRVASVRSMHW